MMMKLAEAARAVTGRHTGADVAFDRVSTDTRTLQQGDLFVALRGERFDGHQFLHEAAAAGAAAAMVDEAGSRIEDGGSGDRLPLLVVDDTKRALGRLAAYWRKKFQLPVVALTGSSGKTTVKEMLASILRAACAGQSKNSRSSVLATRGNLNNDIGVPLMLLELRPDHRYAVIEMGMNHAGEISYLTALAAPDVAVVNNAGRAHIEFLGSEEAIARAKGEIYEGLGDQGVAVINADDAHAQLWRDMTADRQRIEFGLKQGDVTGTYRLRWLESEIAVRTPYGEARATLPAPGVHNVSNALAASAAAVALRIPAPAIAAGLSAFPGIKGRLQKKATKAGATLIDDTYNANPDSVAAAIAVLSGAPGTKVLVLGDMGELGAGAPQFHADAGARARAAGVQHLLTLGTLTAETVPTFGAGAQHFDRLEDLLAAVQPLLAPGVTVLVKGSRFMKMERVVQALEAAAEGREDAGGRAP